MQHDWTDSTLGHGNKMCRRCFVTDLEAAAIGMTDCDVPPPAPKAFNDNVVVLPVVRVERQENDEEDNERICPSTGTYCSGDLAHLCDDYGCAREVGESPHSEFEDDL